MKNYAFVLFLTLSLSACFTSFNTNNDAKKHDPSETAIDIDAGTPKDCLPEDQDAGVC